MLVFHFTYHAYLSWLPDRPEGFVVRERGLQPPNPNLARAYRERATHEAARFDEAIQQLAIAELLIACEKQGYRLHGVGTEPTHIHVVASWATDRTPDGVQAGLRTSLTRRFNKVRGKRPWFLDNSTGVRVKDQEHFQHLLTEYLPSHSGWKWIEDRGMFL